MSAKAAVLMYHAVSDEALDVSAADPHYTVGAGVFVVTIWFIPMHFAAPLFIVAFALLGSAILGTLGPEGVGRATTNAVVAASVAILAANFVLTGLFFT